MGLSAFTEWLLLLLPRRPTPSWAFCWARIRAAVAGFVVDETLMPRVNSTRRARARAPSRRPPMLSRLRTSRSTGHPGVHPAGQPAEDGLPLLKEYRGANGPRGAVTRHRARRPYFRADVVTTPERSRRASSAPRARDRIGGQRSLACASGVDRQRGDEAEPLTAANGRAAEVVLQIEIEAGAQFEIVTTRLPAGRAEAPLEAVVDARAGRRP